MRPRAWAPLDAMLAHFHLAELFYLFLRWLDYREMGISPLVDHIKKMKNEFNFWPLEKVYYAPHLAIIVTNKKNIFSRRARSA